MAIDHEITFCSDAAGWMNQELESRPEIPFGRVKIEQSARGSRKRRDLTIYDRADRVVITGEVKLPYVPEGGSPYHEAVVEDAHRKAAKVGSPFFVTWNVNRLVLWRTDDAGKPLFERHIYEEVLIQVRDEADLVNPTVQQAIRRGLIRFLDRAGRAFTGELPLDQRPLDEFFITVLEAALEPPIAAIRRAIGLKYYRDSSFKVSLDRWMRDTQSWQLSDDQSVQRDNLERAAKFCCYVLVNKIVFYKALRKRFTNLPQLRIPSTLNQAKKLETAFNGFFDRAVKATRDYETVFKGDFGDTLPFLSDTAVPTWRDLVQSIDQFDFTRVNYDVIGPIFERLISPEERHRYGQHYTKAEIVDLIEAFCIRVPEARVLDPACGGGTFLVRAYNRKKWLAERAGTHVPHEELLDQLYGVDVSPYAAHLTTMNLATRDLIDEQNYPLVAHSDFFDVERGRALLQVPMAAGDGNKQYRPVSIDLVDAVVGNPPYVRQEDISKPPTAGGKGRVKIAPRSLDQIKAEAEVYKKRLLASAQSASPSIPWSGRSDLHVYFWPHATGFLKPGGYYGFLTSSGWLDVEYGFKLQEYLLNNYAIIAIFESQVEPWFTGARVTTCATIMRREPDSYKRSANLVRFVQLRSPLSQMFPAFTDEEQRQLAVEALRDRIESLHANATDPHWRVRVIRQSDLHRQGCTPTVSSQAKDREDVGDAKTDLNGDPLQRTEYVGSKWGFYLRAPDLFFELTERFRDRMVELSEVAQIKRGITSGCDKFFFVRDITERCLKETPDPREFRSKYGIQRTQADKVRIVLAGDKSLHLIEAEHLEPEVHSLMEIRRYIIVPADLQRLVLLCSKSKTNLKGTHVLRYIQWGEREQFHKIVTVAARARSRFWYDLTDCVRPEIILPKIQQYRHVVPLNPARLTCNCSLMSVNTAHDSVVLAGVLNSTLFGFMKWFSGRQLGNEANLQLDVYASKNLLVPDPRHATDELKQRIHLAVERLAEREIVDLDDDLESPDRQRLDDAVFELLGVSSPTERNEWLSRLYAELRSLHYSLKEKEAVAMHNRAITSRGSTLSGEQIAAEIWDNLHPSLIRRFPDDFIPPGEPLERIQLPEGPCKLVSSPLTGQAGLEIDGTHIELGDERRAKLVMTAFEAGHRGEIAIPVSPEVCDRCLHEYRTYIDQVDAEFNHLVAEKTANDRMQAKVLHILKRKLSAAPASSLG